jgi:hypothetical protein
VGWIWSGVREHTRLVFSGCIKQRQHTSSRIVLPSIKAVRIVHVLYGYPIRRLQYDFPPPASISSQRRRFPPILSEYLDFIDAVKGRQSSERMRSLVAIESLNHIRNDNESHDKDLRTDDSMRMNGCLNSGFSKLTMLVTLFNKKNSANLRKLGPSRNSANRRR